MGLDYQNGPRANLIKWQDMCRRKAADLEDAQINIMTRTLVQDFVDSFRDDYDEGDERGCSGEIRGLHRLVGFELKYTCDGCTKQLCMRCGENDWHLSRSCLDHLKTLTDDADVQWKLLNW